MNGERKPTRLELVEREGEAADRLSVQLARFPVEARPGRTDAARAACSAREHMERARGEGATSRIELLDGAAESLRKLADAEGLGDAVQDDGGGRRGAIERAGAAADAAAARVAAVECEIMRFPVRAPRDEFDRQRAREVADNIIGRGGGRPEGWDEAVRRLRARADFEGLDGASLDGRGRRAWVLPVDESEHVERLRRAAVELMRPRRGAPFNVAPIFALACVFVEMRAQGIEPPRRHVSRQQAQHADLWQTLLQHGLLGFKPTPQECNDIATWAFVPTPAQVRAVERCAKRYFARARALIEAAGLTPQT